MVSRKVWVANLVVSLILAALVLVDAFLFTTIPRTSGALEVFCWWR